VNETPLISVGVPIRNGGKTLRQALDTVVNQTYRNLDIVVSDNGSNDGSSELLAEYAARDPRIRLFRQDPPLTALSNFRFCFEQSKGQYFLWAAHDDLRSLNYVETLLRGYSRRPDAALVFSEVTDFESYETMAATPPTAHDFEMVGLDFAAKVRKQTRINCTHVYGLINAAYLREYPWFDIESGPDVAMLFWLATRGDFVFEPGAMFYYYRPNTGKSAADRALAITFRRLKPFLNERLAWVCARAVSDASRRKGERRSAVSCFPYLYYHISQGFRGMLHRWMPGWALRLWQRWKGRPAVAATGSSA
jgi:glycosyltransferase involved in cell wall biosynthesis